jgi:glycosyltransferase involved in cell wall biosynthesis
MRILFLSNFYPPARPGGYQQLCQEVAERLSARGHTIGVLTSRHDLEKVPVGEQDIFRVLHLEGDLNFYRPLSFFTSWKKQYDANLVNCRQVISEFEPDLVFIWGMWALSQAIAAAVEELMPQRVVYYLADYWPAAADMHTAYWQTPTRRLLTRIPKNVVGSLAQAILAGAGRPKLRFERVICVSKALRDNLVAAGIPIEHARVIYNGIDVAQFARGIRHDRSFAPLRLLYAGQIASQKGVHTAIEAMSLLRDSFDPSQISLTIIGAGHPHYEASLRGLAASRNLQEYVFFQGARRRDEIPAVLAQFDVLVFPSVYEEPLARMTQEAMFSGLVVVGTTTGGTKELLVEGETGLTFPPEDAAGLARQLTRLAGDAELCRRLAEAGRQSVLAKFTLTRMITEIEDYLREVVDHADSVSHQLLPTS